jgi:hypothetical protein
MSILIQHVERAFMDECLSRSFDIIGIESAFVDEVCKLRVLRPGLPCPISPSLLLLPLPPSHNRLGFSWSVHGGHDLAFRFTQLLALLRSQQLVDKARTSSREEAY